MSWLQCEFVKVLSHLLDSCRHRGHPYNISPLPVMQPATGAVLLPPKTGPESSYTELNFSAADSMVKLFKSARSQNESRLYDILEMAVAPWRPDYSDTTQCLQKNGHGQTCSLELNSY